MRKFALSPFVILSIALLLLGIVNVPVAQAHTANQIPNKISTQTHTGVPQVLPISDAEQYRILEDKFGPRAKTFNLKHYSDSWTDSSTRLTSYATNYGPVWSGYIADVLPTPYYANHVYGNFTIPSANTGGSPSIAEWVGIGGVYGNQYLIQAGAATTLRGGSPIISAFFELLPAPPQDLANVPW